MAKLRTIEDQLAALKRLRAGEKSPAAVAELGDVLQSSKLHGMTLKMAAELAEKWAAHELTSALRAAAEALSPDALGGDANKRDPGCEGKEAVLRALVTWEADVPEFYLRAARWEQRAPVMNGSVDVAAETRGLAGLGIAQTLADGRERAIEAIVQLLADSESKTRVRAAQALGIWRGAEAVPVLRLKALVGDEQAEVLGETFASLLRQDAAAQLPFVAAFLDHDDERLIEAAALAAGESRLPAALAPLIRAWQRHASGAVASSLLMAIALLRQEESLAWLLLQIRECRPHQAANIVDALRLYRGDAKTVERIAAAAKARGGEAQQVYEELFEK